MNISLILMILALLALNPSAVLAGSFINAVTRIDISDGVVTGVGAEYTFALPNSWLGGSVSVNRERPARGSQFIDKLIFLYRPIDRISMPTVFA
ncbi:MAG: hypothetical protein FWE68_01840, partial [Defluviitaleaceae bacterium]|nr:hypothetical protein [Defluviitaleaceae bacterium]